MSLDTYHTLGRSGLRVSRLALGTMTFGQADWGCDAVTAHAIMRRYLEAGGNLIDTADSYAHGGTEAIVGEFMAASGQRDRIVLSSKFSLGGEPGNPNAFGNGRKSMARALEASLKRLKTDYIDLYHLHAWDQMTPVEEVMRALDDAVRQGKIRYAGFSDTPGWVAARAQSLAQCRGWAPLAAMQLSYSLVERGLEYEFPPLCQELGLGLLVWSPLANGLLSGKYKSGVKLAAQQLDARLAVSHVPEEFDPLTEGNWRIIAELEAVAKEIGRPMAQVAINWVANRPAVASVILGSRKLAQFEESLQALNFDIPPDLLQRLDRVSALPKVFPYWFLNAVQGWMNTGVSDKWPGYYGKV